MGPTTLAVSFRKPNLDVRAEEFLDLVVTADEMEIQGAVNILKDEALLETGTGFVEVRSQAADPHATVQVRLSPVGAHGLNGNPHPAAVGLGKKTKLRDEIGIDLNRQGLLRGRR